MTTHATTNGTQTETEARFCAQCGHAISAGDHFCSGCGTALAVQATEAPAPPPQVPANGTTAEPSGKPRRVLFGAGLGALCLAVIAGVLFASGIVSLGSGDSGPSAATERALKAEMVKRDEFFKAERAYLAAYGAALSDLRKYQREERAYKAENKRIEEEFADEFDACYRFAAVPCPQPDYPDPPKAPSFGAETREIRSAAQQFEELRAGLSGVTPSAELAALHNQLLAATESVKAEAEHNADVFDEAVEPADGEAPGGVNRGKIKTLRRDSALPAMRQMNRAAVAAVRALGFGLAEFDVPGGRDLDPKDHSDEA